MTDDALATSAAEKGFVFQRNWISVLLVVICVVVFLALIIPWIHRARLVAQRIQSKNNLKQMGLALSNYHDVHKCFPLGCDTRSDGVGKHGWMFRTVPYLESSPLYSQINQNLAWDHPVNEHRFRRPLSVLLNPIFDEKYDAEGHALTHYLGNPNVLHRDHVVSLADMAGGTENNWLVGEVSSHFQPYAYPFNWRELTPPFDDGHGSFGSGTGDQSVQLCLSDGSVRMLHGETDQAVIKALAEASPIATSHQTKRPNRTFESGDEYAWRHDFLLAAKDEFNLQRKGMFGTEIFYDPEGLAHTADLYSRPDGAATLSHDGSTRIDLHGIVEAYPDLRTVIHDGPLDDTSVEDLLKLRQLEVVVVSKFRVTAESRSRLAAALPKLRIYLPSGHAYAPVDVPITTEN